MKENSYDRYLNDDLSEEEKRSLIEDLQEEGQAEDFAQHIVDSASMIMLSEKILSEESSNVSKQTKRKKTLPFIIWFSTAAALVAIGMYIVGIQSSNETNLVLQNYDSNSYVERDGKKIDSQALQIGDVIYSSQKAIIVDEDGSSITLGKTSQLKIIDYGTSKIFKLEQGHISCKVSPQKGDFKVNCQWFAVNVIGTSFMIYSSATEGKLKVNSGKVVCQIDGEVKTFQKGNILLINKKGAYDGLQEILLSKSWSMEWRRPNGSLGNRRLNFEEKGALVPHIFFLSNSTHQLILDVRTFIYP